MKSKSYGFFYKRITSHNLFLYFLGYSIAFLFILFRIPFLTSFYSPEELGTYTIIASGLGYIEIIFFSWVTGTIWRHAYDKEFPDFGALAIAIIPFLGIMVLFAAVSTLLLVYVLNINDAITVTAAFFSSLSIQLVQIFLNYLVYKKKVKTWCFTISLQSLLSFAILIVMTIVYKLGIRSIFLSILLCNSTIIFYSLVNNFNKLSNVLVLNFGLFKRIFKYSFLLTLLSILLTIINNADRFIVDYYKGKELLGKYSQNYGLASVGLFAFIQFFNTLFIPVYSKNLATDAKNQSNQRIIQLYVFVFLPIIIFLVSNSGSITNILLGKEFEGFSDIFNWVAIGVCLFGFANFFEIRLKFLRKTRVVLVGFGVFALLNVIVNSFLLANNGIKTASLVTLFTYFFILLFLITHNWHFFLKLNLSRLLLDLMYATIIYLTLNFFLEKLYLSDWGSFSLNALVALIVYSIFLRRHYYIVTECIAEVV